MRFKKVSLLYNNINKEFLPKKSSQKIFPKNPPKKNPPKRILPKKSSQKIPLKKFLQKESKKNPKNSPKKSLINPKHFQTIFQKVPNF